MEEEERITTRSARWALSQWSLFSLSLSSYTRIFNGSDRGAFAVKLILWLFPPRHSLTLHSVCKHGTIYLSLSTLVVVSILDKVLCKIYSLLQLRQLVSIRFEPSLLHLLKRASLVTKSSQKRYSREEDAKWTFRCEAAKRDNRMKRIASTDLRDRL